MRATGIQVVRRKSVTVLAAAVLAVCVVGGDAMAEWNQTYRNVAPAAGELRGFGRVESESSEYRGDDGMPVWIFSFRCAGNAQSSTVAGKLLADLQMSRGSATRSVRVGGVDAECLTTTSGGAFIICVDGAVARVVCASELSTLERFLADAPEQVAGAVESAEYPAFLDRWDHWGWGLYGLGGFENTHGWMDNAGGKDKADPLDDFKFLAEHKFRFEPWLDPALLDNSDGVTKNSGSEWMVEKAKEAGLPFSFRVYGPEGGADWTARRFSRFMEKPAEFLTSGWHSASQFWKAQPHLSWNIPDIHKYIAVQVMDLMRPFKDEPLAMSWMHPHGELFHDEWYDMHDDYSQPAIDGWHGYLKKRELGLDDVSRMYGRHDEPFTSWDMVPIPEFATFAGLGGRVLSLGGAWSYRIENKGERNAPDAWWSEPIEKRYRGIGERWFDSNADLSDWGSIRMPGDDGIFAVLPDANRHEATTWFKRSFVFDRQVDEGERLYVYWFPISFTGIHSGEHKRFHGVYVNGARVGEVGRWGALDVTDHVRAGRNEIALHLMGGVWNGRVFLSTEEPKVYPYLGEDMNRLWILWRSWHIDTKFDRWIDVLDGMRQVDPNRPIKFMAPAGFGADRWIDLASRYGGWPHFTGEGVWFYPWFKRYAHLYGLPGTSELAGPCNNVDEQFNGFRRTFLAGLDGHEPVFMAQSYTRNPELRRWWVEHKPVLKRMGTYDIDGPQVLLYRTTKQTSELAGPMPYPELGIASREIQNPWNWDIGRGTLQTIGHSYLYIDDGGLADGKMYGHDVMMDCGNETMDVGAIRHIESWVRAGGTFVTLPFTGRNSLVSPDSWPSRTLTGCTVARMREPGKGRIEVLKDQSVFTALAGRSFDDAGHSTDYVGNNHNLLSVELEPNPDCEVLARFENGAPAIVRRKLGKGSVIVLGTAFWRGAVDRMGLWWPTELETEFLSDLLKGVSFSDAVCTTDDRMVWAQPYRSNNGLDAVAVLVSWHEDEDVFVTVRFRTPVKPQSLSLCRAGGVDDVKFTWDDGALTATVHVPAREVVILTAQVHSPGDAVNHWWARQQRRWRELAKPRIDFAPYREGIWRDPALDLRPGARFSSDDERADWAALEFDDSAWTEGRLGMLTLQGAPNRKPVRVRKSFTVPSEWAALGGKILLVSGSWSGPQYIDSARMLLNGVELHGFTEDTYNEYDVTRMLRDGKNVVAFEFKGASKHIGFAGNVYLYHRAPPAQSVSLEGSWRGTEGDGSPGQVRLPGKGTLKSPRRNILIPEAWRGKYRVMLYMEGSRNSILGAWVNGRMVRRFHHSFGERCEVDITRMLEFGEENEVMLIWGNEWQGRYLAAEEVGHWDVREIRLDLFEAEDE